MKIRGMVCACVALSLVIVGLGCYIYLDFVKDAEAAEAQTHLADTMFKTNVRRLVVALEEENQVTAYHFAETAADNAASGGRQEAALFFRKISAGISDGASNMVEIAEAVEKYVETGTIPSQFAVSYDTTENRDDAEQKEEPSSVSNYRRTAAMECAAAIIGVNKLMKPVEKSNGGEFVFTCRNAYAVIDARSTSPVEAGISLAPGEERLSESACVAYADSFIHQYFPSDIASSAYLVGAQPDKATGVYELIYQCRNKTIKIAVKRDTGKVVRLVAR